MVVLKRVKSPEISYKPSASTLMVEFAVKTIPRLTGGLDVSTVTEAGGVNAEVSAETIGGNRAVNSPTAKRASVFLSIGLPHRARISGKPGKPIEEPPAMKLP